jgi:hypothetical protein
VTTLAAALLANWSAVWPNLEASMLWATPAFIASHIVHRRYLRRELARHHVRSVGPAPPA